MDAIPRLRMIAGPNGSGKSTLRSLLRPELVGVYVNADDIEREIRETGGLVMAPFKVHAEDDELRPFLASSELLAVAGLVKGAAAIAGQGDRVDFGGVEINSYHAAVLADFIRRQLLAASIGFTFETVMSSADKVDLLCNARAAGYRTYLYYVATERPSINVARVRHRVASGGHDVPEDKIVSRYERSLANLRAAVHCTHRAYIFDNSADTLLWLAEVTDGSDVEFKQAALPPWFFSALPLRA